MYAFLRISSLDLSYIALPRHGETMEKTFGRGQQFELKRMLDQQTYNRANTASQMDPRSDDAGEALMPCAT